MSNGLAVLTGSQKVDVAFKDGRTESVDVCTLELADWAEATTLIGGSDPTELVELYCRKPKGWAKDLTNGSAMDVIEKGDELNGDFFLRWLARQRRIVQAVNQPSQEKPSQSKTTSPK